MASYPDSISKPIMSHRLNDRVFRIILIANLIVACSVAAIFTGRGIFLLGFSNEKPNDLALRWREQHYISKGQNPYDISEHLYQKDIGEQPSEKVVILDSKLGGTPIASGYPPWAFFWSNVFIPPLEWAVTRTWFFIANLAALGLIGGFAWKNTPESKLSHRLFMVSCALSANSVGTTLGNGQWGLILCALLVLIPLQLDKGKWWAPALYYAFTLLKPTFSFTHVVMMWRRKAWPAFLLAGTLTAVVTMVISWQVKTNPLMMISQMLEQTARWDDISYSIADAIVALGIHRGAVMLGCMTLAVALSWAMLRGIRADAILELAVCGTLARVFTYHQLYDNVLIIFLVLASAQLFLKKGRWNDLTILGLLLVSVWLPGRFTGLVPVQVFQISIWTASLYWLVHQHRQEGQKLSNLQITPKY